MKNQGRIITVLVIALIVIIFAVLNTDPVAISFGFATVHWPLVIVLIVSLLLGAVITILASTTSTLSLKKEQKAQSTELNQLKTNTQAQIDGAVKAATERVEKDYANKLAAKDTEISSLKEQIAQSDAPDGPTSVGQ